jgi:hypothetical protein
MNYLPTMFLMAKKMMSMLLTFLFTCLAFFRLGSLSVSSSIRKTEKQGGWGTTVMHFLGQKFSGVEGSVRRCVIAMQRPVLLSPIFESNT